MTNRWLGLALYAEGTTDHRFLDELLPRAVEHLLVGAGHMVDLSPIQRLPLDPSDTTRADRIVNGAERIQGEFHLLFVHADGGGDPREARRNNVKPGLDRVLERLGENGRRGVAVVPVRETEAWALADLDAVRATFGTTKQAAHLGLPSSLAQLEGLPDPKATFAMALRRARPGRQGRRRPSPTAFLDLLGERSSINALRDLPAFKELLNETRDALRGLGYSGIADA